MAQGDGGLEAGLGGDLVDACRGGLEQPLGDGDALLG